MDKGNATKAQALGMPFGTATNRLRKALLFSMAKRLDEDHCFRCGEQIKYLEDLSIEHKVPWLGAEDPVGLFFSLDNIAFSHLSCNSSAGDKGRVWPDPQTCSRVKSQRRRADPITRDHDNRVRRLWRSQLPPLTQIAALRYTSGSSLPER